MSEHKIKAITKQASRAIPGSSPKWLRPSAKNLNAHSDNRALHRRVSDLDVNHETYKVATNADEKNTEDSFSPLKYALLHSDVEMVKFLMNELGAEASDNFHFYLFSILSFVERERFKNLQTIIGLSSEDKLKDLIQSFVTDHDHGDNMASIIVNDMLRFWENNKAMDETDKHIDVNRIKTFFELLEEKGVDIGKVDLAELGKSYAIAKIDAKNAREPLTKWFAKPVED